MALSPTRISKVALVGAGGNLGRHITHALLSTKHHTLTALTRSENPTQFPDSVLVKRINYDDPQTLIAALKGQDVLIVTLSGRARIQETEEKLVRAAAEANVPWILPNEWSPNTANEALVADVPMFQPKVATRKMIAQLGVSSCISLCTGFWYDYTLPNPDAFGFDIANRSATFFDEGETPISVSTLHHVGEAVAALLSLPVSRAEGDSAYASSAWTLSSLANKVHYVASFTITQRDMFVSLLRATGTEESDWAIHHEPVRERYATGLEQMQRGECAGFGKVMYSRVFFDDGCGDFRKRSLDSDLGMEDESLDAVTWEVVEQLGGM